ncbi:Phosphatidylinositol 4-kinase stt4 [Yarrowia sp. C11]|nr:Phosphatidylinositol 4-kinase stt4 [Yarrowia sp. C11]KAG5370951.1 Phosphatidylinositol 4-kinase stt4 [Yarrowia sp. E02]
MEDFGISRAGLSIRAKALAKLAKYAAISNAPTADSDLDKLNSALGQVEDKSGIPMSPKELEVLLALAGSAKYVANVDRAASLLQQLGQYLIESPKQVFAKCPVIRKVYPSPWELVTKAVTAAVLDLGINFPALYEESHRYIFQYITVAHELSSGRSLDVLLPFVLSIHGFLAELARKTDSFSVEDRQKLFTELKWLTDSSFLLEFETEMSKLRSSEDESTWASIAAKYQVADLQLGAMVLSAYFCDFCRALATSLVIVGDASESSVLDSIGGLSTEISNPGNNLLNQLNEYAIREIHSLDEGASYIELASPDRVLTALNIKASALEIVGVAVHFGIVHESDTTGIIESSLELSSTMQSERLMLTLFKLGSLIGGSRICSTLVRFLPHYACDPGVSPEDVREATAVIASRAMVSLSEDSVVSSVYTLVNLLTPIERSDDQWEQVAIFQNVVTAAVTIAIEYGETTIAVLVSNVLAQKLLHISPEIDQDIILGLSDIALHVPEKEFKSILKVYSSLVTHAFEKDNKDMLRTVTQARNHIATSLKKAYLQESSETIKQALVDGPSTEKSAELYQPFLSELLFGIVSKGEVAKDDRSQNEVNAVAEEIGIYLPPLAHLLPEYPEPALDLSSNPDLQTLFRNAWFNMVVHGYAPNSDITKKYQSELENIARSTPPLVSDNSPNKMESDLELNTVLRRGSSRSNVNNQKANMAKVFSMNNSFEIRSLHYPKLMFIAATMLVETLRAGTGNCGKVLMYFGDKGFNSGETGRHMAGIATDVTKVYIMKVLRGHSPPFTAQAVAEQIKEMLVCCCHRVAAIQDVAFACTDLLIRSVPSALCQKQSLYALLELLTLLWGSCIDAETDEYEPRSVFKSNKEGLDITLELSDSYSARQYTLKRFQGAARQWVQFAMAKLTADMKSLLQSYLVDMEGSRDFEHVSLGCSFALEMGGSVTGTDRQLASLKAVNDIPTDTVSGFLSQYMWRNEFRDDGAALTLSSGDAASDLRYNFYSRVASITEKLDNKAYVAPVEVKNLLFSGASYLSRVGHKGVDAARLLVQIPFRTFSETSIKTGISMWLWIASEIPALEYVILAEVYRGWETTVHDHVGLYSRKHDIPEADYARMEYAPSNKKEIDHDSAVTLRTLEPHHALVRYISSRFNTLVYDSPHVLKQITVFLTTALQGLHHASLHALSRETRFELILLALDVLNVQNTRGSKGADRLFRLIIRSALTWFAQPPQWPFGGNRLRMISEIRLFTEVSDMLKNVGGRNASSAAYKDLLVAFISDELIKMTAWADPLQNGAFKPQHRIVASSISSKTVQDAWNVDPTLAVFLVERYASGDGVKQLEKLINAEPLRIIKTPQAVPYFLQNATPKTKHYLLLMKPVSPISSINLFLPAHRPDSITLQYAMRSLESHDVNLVFFYVPQIVQLLRYDQAGYVERYILETAKLSQLFAHQIIWNILANSYKDEDSTIPDPMKPTLDHVVERMIDSFNAEEKSFYEREFGFFAEVTDISGKLKPYIKKTKAEKKAKIDEEINKIKVDVGVYLPSNPDGTVIDIDRKSGRPLQSHAKAPYMATFKIRREVRAIGDDDEDVDEDGQQLTTTIEKWQSAIFKVGDDCRQDVLALQIISVFRSIFNSYGMDLYVFPYRVTATAPGCGVIDVLPDSISRDMLGREAVNGLYEYFTSKHGSEDSIQFQRARNNFVKSLAAYSVISYLIQFKDRHNGNIMYDGQGHILHIDFGFCFDIVPGGVKFEAAPFKLTHEMVLVMGGNTQTQAYRWFEELSVKAFLACRPHAETIIQLVLPMLDSGLPCFKEHTIRNLRRRFVLEKTEAQAATHFRGLIKKSIESFYTKGYDEFQRITNGIPY